MSDAIVTWVWIACLALALLLVTWYLAALLIAIRRSRQAGRELRRIVAELDASGEPWRWDDLAASRRAGADENKACDLIVQVASKVPAELSKQDAILRWLNRPRQARLTQLDFEGSDGILAALAPILVEARKIIDLPVGRFQVPWPEDKIWQEVDALREVRVFSQLLCGAAHWHAHSGDLSTALEDCLAMQRASLTLDSSWLELYVHWAIVHLALESLQHVLAQGPPEAGQVDRLLQACAACIAPTPLVASCRGERAMAHRFYEAIASGKFSVLKVIASIKKTSLPWAILNYPFVLLKLKPAHVAALRIAKVMLQAAQLPDPHAFRRWRDLLDETIDSPFPELVPEGGRKIFEAYWRVQAQLRCAVAALAVERFRSAYDLWPQSLGEICPGFLESLPLDPFTGEPLQYWRTTDGVVIFSTGPKGVLPQGPGPIEPGYGFSLWDLPHRGQYAASLAPSGITSEWPNWR